MCLCGPSWAALEPDLKTPYHLRIVIKVSDHRFLTPQFRDHLDNELRQRLLRTYGKLVEVETVRSHPLLSEIDARGLDGALETLAHLEEERTYFALIGFDNDRYDVQVRFYDGPSGLPSPLTRRAATFERGQVAGVLARLIEETFGPTGTVTKVSKEEVEVGLQGGGLSDLGKHLQAGEVLAVSRIHREGGQMRATRIDWALLVTVDAPKEGVVRCHYHHRFAEDQLKESKAVLGYRCLKLPTAAQGKVLVRLLDDAKAGPLAGWQVHVSDSSGKKEMEQATNRDGLARFSESLRHFALVKIVSGGTVRARFPVPLIDERPILCRLKTDATAEAQAPLELRRDQWLRRLFDELALAVERDGELQRQLNQSLPAALKHAKAGLERLDEELANLKSERLELDRLTDTKKVPRFDLAEADGRLGDLRVKKEELAGFISRLEALTKESGAENLSIKKWAEQATLLETQADFDQAIKYYEKILQANPKQEDVKGRLETLRQAWAIKSEAHAQAREYIYQSWPRLEVSELKTALPHAEKALAACQQANDKLTPRKLLLANAAHASALKKRLDELRKKDSDDNRAQAKQIGLIVNGFRELHTAAAKWVGTAKKN